MSSRSRTLFISFGVASFCFGLVVACTGGPGGLGEFGDDGLGQTSSSQQSNGSSSGSSSGRPSSSSGATSSSGISGASSGTTSSGATSSGATSSGATSSGGSSGTTTIQCGSTVCTSATQYCIKPCCPLDPDCIAAPDGGICGAGYKATPEYCNNLADYGCRPTCKNSTTPYCTTNPSTSALEGSCTTSTATRTVTCLCD